MSLPIKIGIGLATVGTVGGVGYSVFAYSQDKGTEISKLIEEEFKYKLLDTGDDKDATYWDTNWKNYQTNNKDSERDIFGLEGWTKGAEKDLKDKLKEKCQELSKTKIQNKEEKLYGQVTSYCGRYVTVQDEAKKNNLKILETADANSGDVVWNTRHTKTTDLAEDFKKIGITEKTPTKDQIRAGCKKATIEKTKKESDYEAAYRSYVKVCTSQEGEQ